MHLRSLTAVLAAVIGILPPPAHGDPISFRNDVMPVLSKAGCNAGACHGNASGKAGFKLSLRGEDPEFDFKALTRDQSGRRTNPIDPDKSLMLLKATTQVAHEGGLRFKTDSVEYDLLRRWMMEGPKDDGSSAATLDRIEVVPREKIVFEPDSEVQLSARAFFSDGSTRDITSRSVYETANPVAKVSHGGKVTRERSGETTVLVRFLQAQAPVRLAFVPARPNFREEKTPRHNYVDEHVFVRLRQLRMNPSALCSDNEFVRRAYLDLLGIIPTADEARAFVADSSKRKRERLVDRLLERPEFADSWGAKWSDLFRMEERVLDRKGLENFQHWIRQSLLENKPLDVFARELIAARGSTYQSAPANYYRANRDSVTRAEAAAQVFLGIRLQCAQCHNHPFDRWTQEDYYNWAGFFARVRYKVIENKRRDNNDNHEFKGEQIVYFSPKSELKNPRSGRPAQPRFLGTPGPAGNAEEDPLDALATWMTGAKNPHFARAQANRIWFHLMGRGIVDPIDDFRSTNPASHPALLDALAADLVEHHFDLRHLIRVIMASRTYQLSSVPNESSGEDESNYSHTLPRRLAAEQLLDSESQVAGVPLRFAGYPPGTRAIQVPTTVADRKHDRKLSQIDQALDLFGKPPRLLTCECERSNETTMSQAFQLISGPALNDLLTAPGNRLGRLAESQRSHRELVEELYWSALSRPPMPAELDRHLAAIASSRNRREVLEDITWALVNAKEFVFRK